MIHNAPRPCCRGAKAGGSLLLVEGADDYQHHVHVIIRELPQPLHNLLKLLLPSRHFLPRSSHKI
nr:MAG TPA: hypothetical protein [Caudoviricetes sp.]